MYVHELAEWPDFSWDEKKLSPLLVSVETHLKALGKELSEVGFEDQTEASLRSLTSEVVKTSEIEGERLDPVSVRSSIAQKLGLPHGGLQRSERNVDGIVEVVLDATQKYADPLSEKRLFGWHAALFPTGYSDLSPVLVGGWRDDSGGPMQVVSGPYGNRKVHFEAPAHLRLAAEMEKFIDWFNSENGMDLFVKAGVAHFWFVTIHPFSDGNGRIARAIADLMLARADKMTQRYYSMSTQIHIDKADYYNILEGSQKGTLDITEWLEWFLKCLVRAMQNAEILLKDILQKARVWQFLSGRDINDRQRKILNLLLDGSFEGKLSAAKYSKITNCSTDTAGRDLGRLEEFGVLIRIGQGKATRYELNPLAAQTGLRSLT